MPEATQPTAPSSSSAPSPSAPAAASAPATSSAPSNPTSTAAPAATTPAAPGSAAPSAAPVPAARPGYVPESHWDGQTNKIKDEKAYTDWVNGNAAFKAAADSERLTRPQTPDAYKIGTTQNFKPPEGLAFTIDDKDPLWPQARAWAHKHGLSQEAFAEGIDLIAGKEIGTAQSTKNYFDAEVAKLGTAATQRIDAVIQWINATAGPEAKALGDAMKIAPVAGTIIAFENMMKRFQTQGAASFSTAHQAPPPSKPDDKTYQSWTFQQRMNFARTGDPNNSSLQS